MKYKDMIAGEEIDALIAEKIMGFTISETDLEGNPGKFITFNNGVAQICYSVPHYSLSISSAWEVVEKMHEKSETITVEYNKNENGWWCIFIVDVADNDQWYLGEADTPMLAICRAALASTGEQDE